MFFISMALPDYSNVTILFEHVALFGGRIDARKRKKLCWTGFLALLEMMSFNIISSSRYA